MNQYLANAFNDELEKIAATVAFGKSGQKIRLSEREMDAVFPRRIKADTRSRGEITKSIESKRKKQNKARNVAGAGILGTIGGMSSYDLLPRGSKLQKAVGAGTALSMAGVLGGGLLADRYRRKKNREKVRLLMRAAKDTKRSKK